MLTDYFKIDNTNVKKLNSTNELFKHFQNADSLNNASYIPDKLSSTKTQNKFSNKSFKNFSFAKTEITGIIFIDCTFTDCLFTSVHFIDVKFDNCKFDCVNFAGSSFHETHIDPITLKKAIPESKYSNVALHLYSKLRENYNSQKQIEWFNISDYYFRKWRRIRNIEHLLDSETNFRRKLSLFLNISFDFLYYLCVGYGIKTYRYFIFSICLLASGFLINLFSYNHSCLNKIEATENFKFFSQMFYYTLTTYTNLGSSLIYPQCPTGLIIISIQSLFGMIWSAGLIAIIMRKLFR